MTERYRDKMSQEAFSLAASEIVLSPKALEIAWCFLVGGLSLAATAKKHGVTRERVREIVARVYEGPQGARAEGGRR